MKKNLIITLLLALSLGGGYYLLMPPPKNNIKCALEFFINEDYGAAEKNLNDSLPNNGTTYPLKLYHAYIAQANGRYKDSDLYLQMALKEIQKNPHPESLFEIFLAQAANGYLQQKDHDIFNLIDSANQLFENRPITLFYEGLSKYGDGQYHAALTLWSNFNPIEPENSSGWMAPALEKTFPISWRELHLAHCLIEEGDFISGREILEKESHQLGGRNQDLNNLAALFLGLSYLKESKELHIDQKESYYKLARFYFEHSGHKELFIRERNRVVFHLLNETESLLLNNSPTELQRWGFAFIHTLQEWNAQNAIDMITDKLAEKIALYKGSEMLDFCQLIRKEFYGTPFHLLLTEKLLSSLAHGIKDGAREDLFELWDLVEALSPSSKQMSKQIATLTTEELFQTINSDNATLSRTRHYLEFWKHLGCDAIERDRMAILLFSQAQQFWNREGYEWKASSLMEIAFELCEDKLLLQKGFEQFLVNLYTQAEESNLIGRLSLIHDAMNHFHIGRKELVNPAKIANHLADAQYLYEAHHYNSAKTHATWVLKLDPSNERALRLMGLSSFHLGEYSNALATLRKIENPDDQTLEVLMLSHAFSSQQPEKHIAQIDHADSFDDE